MKITQDTINLNLDTEIYPIEKITGAKKSNQLQGKIYINAKAIGKTVIVFLVEPTEQHKSPITVETPLGDMTYYDMMIKYVSSTKVSEKQNTGTIYLPEDYVGKKVRIYFLNE